MSRPQPKSNYFCSDLSCVDQFSMGISTEKCVALQLISGVSVFNNELEFCVHNSQTNEIII